MYIWVCIIEIIVSSYFYKYTKKTDETYCAIRLKGTKMPCLSDSGQIDHQMEITV